VIGVRTPVAELRDLRLRCGAVGYDLAVHGAELGVAPLAAVCTLDESVGFPMAPAGAVGELVVTCGVVPLRAATLIPLDACVTYCGVRLFHHAARPANQPLAAGGCRFPSYAGVDMGYATMPGRLNSSLRTDPSVRIC
jgi:hypothetical protein